MCVVICFCFVVHLLSLANHSKSLPFKLHCEPAIVRSYALEIALEASHVAALFSCRNTQRKGDLHKSYYAVLSLDSFILSSHISGTNGLLLDFFLVFMKGILCLPWRSIPYFIGFYQFMMDSCSCPIASKCCQL